MSHSSAIKTQLYRKAPRLKYFGFCGGVYFGVTLTSS